MTDLKQMKEQVREHLTHDIIPFWKSLRDDTDGGYYGYLDYDLSVDKKAVKGCILNSRIMWFFSNAYMLLKDESLLNEARHGFEFMKKACWDKALDMAYRLYELIESRMRDEGGYKEAFDEKFNETDNEKLSENGVMAQRTMNTLLHVFEAYTELYRVDKNREVAEKIRQMMDTVTDKIYNPKLHRQEVFFDDKWNSIIDLHSYGHDIETAWLVDRSLEILDDERYSKKLHPITADLTDCIYRTAFDGSSLANECERGKVNEWRIWWVQAETVVGFLNGYEKSGRKEYLDAACSEWEFIKKHVIDRRDGYTAGKEWYWRVSKDGAPDSKKPIVEPWKCPYHNGRMCFEVIRRITRMEQNGGVR